MREPIYSLETISWNYQRLQRFKRRFISREQDRHNRFFLYENIPLNSVINLLMELRCNRNAVQDSYSDFARFLQDWEDTEDMPPIPTINIAIKNSIGKRVRNLSISKPKSAEEARRNALGIIGPLLSGRAGKVYLGDYYADKNEKWHKENPGKTSSEPRPPGDDLLIIFYLLEANYIRNSIFDPTDIDEENPLGKWKREAVYLQPGDRFYVEIPEGQEHQYPVLAFAAFTPLGGPQYGLGVNALLNPEKIKQIGLTALQEELIQEEV